MPVDISAQPALVGVNTRKVLEEYGFNQAEIDALMTKNAVAGPVKDDSAAA